MITAFRFRDLRSIEDSGVVRLKRINVLVGRNSSGKSTLLRFLPLLRQSVEQQTRGPVLWYGRLVDFGNFENAARNNNSARGIGFEFSINAGSARGLNMRRNQFSRGEQIFVGKGSINIEVSLQMKASTQGVGVLRALGISIGDDRLELDIGESGELRAVKVSDNKVPLNEGESWHLQSGKMVPIPILLEDRVYTFDEGEHEVFTEPADSPFHERIVAVLKDLAHGRTSSERLSEIAGRIPYGKSKDFFENLIELPGIPATMRNRIVELGPASSIINRLRRWVLLSKITNVAHVIDDEIGRFATSVRYIEPLRALAERYYRQQDLAVDEIDSRGANVAMFLNSLTQRELDRLTGWTEKYLGFRVAVRAEGGHVQVSVSDEDHEFRNIADLGFGYSQVLPIVLQLWKSSENGGRAGSPLVAIEQPELHLHPFYQAKLADAMVATVSTRLPNSPRIFIETHSDHFVNRLGALISDGKISAEHVQVLVVEEGNSGASKVTVATYDNEGMLGDGWPVGFFSPGRKW